MGPLDLVTAPVLGPLEIIHRLGRRILELAGAELYDDDRLVGEIIRLQVRYEMGRMSEEKYYRRHKALIQRANAIRRDAKRIGTG